jgi:hypothetical protein
MTDDPATGHLALISRPGGAIDVYCGPLYMFTAPDWARLESLTRSLLDMITGEDAEDPITLLRKENAQLHRRITQLHNDIQGYQVRDGYETGWRHGEATATQAVEQLRSERAIHLAAIHQAATDKQALIDALCLEAVQMQIVREHFTDDISDRSACSGKINGIYVALCLLHGWDPREDSYKDGKAEQLVLDWQNRNGPEIRMREDDRSKGTP